MYIEPDVQQQTLATSVDFEAQRADLSQNAKKHQALYIWYVVLLLMVVNVCNYMDRMAVSVLAPAIKEDLQLSDGQLGLLTGFAFALFYAVCGIPIAMWADRGVRRNIIALALMIWSVMTGLCGVVQNFWQLFLARVGVGVGEAGCIPAGQSLVCDYVPRHRRAGAFAVMACGIYGGMLVGMALAGWLADAVGWRTSLVILAVPGIVLAVVVRLTLREPRRGEFDPIRDGYTLVSFSQTLRVLWQNRAYRLLIIFYVLNGTLVNGMAQWWPSFYVRVFGLSMSSAGVYLGIAIGVGSGIGLLAGALLSNKIAQHNSRLQLMMGAAGIFLGLPTALAALFVSSTSVSIALVALTMILWGIVGGPSLAVLYSLAQPKMRATAGALATFFQSALGFSLGPSCVGVLSDFLAPSFGSESLRYALLAPLALVPLIVFSLRRAANALPRDPTAYH